MATPLNHPYCYHTKTASINLEQLDYPHQDVSTGQAIKYTWDRTVLNTSMSVSQVHENAHIRMKNCMKNRAHELIIIQKWNSNCIAFANINQDCRHVKTWQTIASNHQWLSHFRRLIGNNNAAMIIMMMGVKHSGDNKLLKNRLLKSNTLSNKVMKESTKYYRWMHLLNQKSTNPPWHNGA